METALLPLLPTAPVTGHQPGTIDGVRPERQFARMTPLATLSQKLLNGTVTSRELVDRALDAITAADGEGPRAILQYDAKRAIAAAEAVDALKKAGYAPSPLAGIPLSVKDLFDIAGEVTTAGSVLLKNAPAAEKDAPAIARLRRAGLILIGRTNMTEFAYSGVGLNSHYGTPKNPYDRNTGRIPGGSSSGAAVSVTDGMAAAAIGTDTGGSIRIPSALCGLTGFKPTARRIPTDGVYPLCESLDSIGPLAPTVSCCAAIDGILSGNTSRAVPELPVSGLRLAVPQAYVLDDLDQDVAKAFEAALSRLSDAGAQINEIPFECLADIPRINANGGIYAEAWAVHENQFGASRDQYDPRVAARLERVSGISATEYIKLLQARAALIAEADDITAPFDAAILPTTPSSAPPIAALEADEEVYVSINMRMLRNTFCFNFLDRCALTIPMHQPDMAPSGLMVIGETMGDTRLLSAGLAIEKTIRRA